MNYFKHFKSTIIIEIKKCFTLIYNVKSELMFRLLLIKNLVRI